jgi:hypothetical protein
LDFYITVSDSPRLAAPNKLNTKRPSAESSTQRVPSLSRRNSTLTANRNRETTGYVKQRTIKTVRFSCFLLNPTRFTHLPCKSDLWQSGLHW